MSYGLMVMVKGDNGCFTRPEMKAERVSYDCITPSAARGIIEAIYWKPAITWIIDKIHVLNKIEFTNIRRNEVSDKISTQGINAVMKGNEKLLYQSVNERRQQRASMILKNVAYVIEAHFELTEKKGKDDTVEKHYAIATRRIKKGQCYNQPYLGTREFSASFEAVENGIPKSYYYGQTIDLQWMLHDIDFKNNMEAKFFRAMMVDGIIDVGVKK